MYNLSYAGAERKLDEVDKEQRSFFKKVFKRKDASPYEFDLVLNMDFIQNPGWAVEIVHTAFRTKFTAEKYERLK
jgi:RNase adaptor protein for sRNA GlmZ degradation